MGYNILYNRPDVVLEYMRSVLQNDFQDNVDQSTAIGILKDGVLIAGVAYNLYNGKNVFMTIATDSGKNWATRKTLNAIFAYPFFQLGCSRVSALVRKSNKKSKRLCSRLGYVNEGCLRSFSDDEENMLVFGMLKKECRWI